MSQLNINRLLDNRQGFLENLYFEYKAKKTFEFDISNILNKKFNEIKTKKLPIESQSQLFDNPDEEIIFHLTLSEIFGELQIWFFNPNESIYQITSLSFVENPQRPNGIFGKQDRISVMIQSQENHLRLNYNFMGENFKSIEMQGNYEILSKSYFAKKIKSSTVFTNVILKISLEIDNESREILESCNFNTNELEAEIYSVRKVLALPLSVFFLDNPDYDQNHSLYLNQLNLNKFHFKTEEAYRRFLSYLTQNAKSKVTLGAVQEFQKLDDTIFSFFSVSK